MNTINIEKLRQRAEILLNAQGNPLKQETLNQIEDLFHELQLRELELQIQNEDLQLVQQEMENAKEHYLDIYHHSPVGYFTLNEDGIILDVNETGTRLLGVNRDELVGTLFARFVEKNDQEQFYSHFKTLTESQLSASDEVRLIRSDHSRFYAQVQSIAVRDEANTQYRLTVNDITQHRQNNLIAVLLNASQHLTGAMDLDLLLTILVGAVLETLPTAESALLWLYDEQEKKLVVRTAVGKDADSLKQFELPPDDDTVGLLVRTGQGRLFNNLIESSGHHSARHGLLDQMGSAAGVPLRRGGKITGALMAYRHLEAGTFTSMDLYLLEALATQISLVMQSASQLEQIRSANDQLRFLTHKLLSVQEEERQRISRELHDEAGQSLTMLKLDLQTVRRDLPAELQPLNERLNRSIELIDQTTQRIRELSYLLRPPTLDTLNLNDVLKSHCEDFADRSSLTIVYQCDSALPTLTETVKITLYRFVQESLTNIARHAKAKTIHVTLAFKDGMLTASVEDDGVGFDPQTNVVEVKQPHGIGLIGIRERLEAVGGQLEILSHPGDGAKLTAYIPVERSSS